MQNFFRSTVITLGTFLVLLNTSFAASGRGERGVGTSPHLKNSRAETPSAGAEAESQPSTPNQTLNNSTPSYRNMNPENTGKPLNTQSLIAKKTQKRVNTLTRIAGNKHMDYNLKKALIFLLVAAILKVAGVVFWPLWPFSWLLNVLSIVFFVFAIVYFVMFLIEA